MSDAKQLFDKMEAMYRKQVWLPKDRDWGYPLLAAVTLATYHARHADTWPIIDVEGPTASGKGQILAMIRAFGWRTRPIAVVPTPPQLYRYAHVEKGKEPVVVIFDEMRVRDSVSDVRAILNAGVERKVVVRAAGGKDVKFRPWGMKVLAHEDPLPKSMQSLRRRCIRILTFHSEEFVPALPKLRDVKRAAKELEPALAKWHDADLQLTVAAYLKNEGQEKLLSRERPTWHLVMAVAEYCGRRKAVVPALEAYRREHAKSIEEWWASILPKLRASDPKKRGAEDLLYDVRRKIGANTPPISSHKFGKLLREAIDRGTLPWNSRQLHGATVYERAKDIDEGI